MNAHPQHFVMPRLPLLVALSLLVMPTLPAAQRTTALPPRLERYMTDVVKMTAEDRARLMASQPVTAMLETDEGHELAVFGAIWINAPMRRYAEAARDIETFERGGGYRVTRRISSPPRIQDFALMRLPDEDVTDLRECQVGDCELKLGEQALERIRKQVNWNGPNARSQVDTLFRQFALEYTTGYLQGGNERLAVYRDGSRPTFVANEFRSMVEQTPGLSTYMPEVRRYLLGYPTVTLPGATSFLYWQEVVFGLKPTIRISHLTVREGADETVVVSKMLYASHYFWTGVELRVLIPDPSRGAGFWFVTVSRSRSDGLTGFTGLVVRGRVKSEVEKGALTALESAKRLLETAR